MCTAIDLVSTIFPLFLNHFTVGCDAHKVKGRPHLVYLITAVGASGNWYHLVAFRAEDIRSRYKIRFKQHANSCIYSKLPENNLLSIVVLDHTQDFFFFIIDSMFFFFQKLLQRLTYIKFSILEKEFGRQLEISYSACPLVGRMHGSRALALSLCTGVSKWHNIFRSEFTLQRVFGQLLWTVIKWAY